jgi:uncharacterized membrane protein YoaK (UPF0700 family)
MFRHEGKTRNFKHNLGIASLLSFVAGLVNVTGFLAVQKLTTNITGHFAYLIDEVFKLEWFNSLVYFLYIFFFFLGSFTSNLLIEISQRKHSKMSYQIPVFLESFILLVLAIFGAEITQNNPDALAFTLLFSMGLQNALVTKISKATVRTTHLTGLFTDLGIELSQLIFYKLPEQQAQLWSSIKLRLTIISFFFLGGITGGVFYTCIELKVLLLAALVLISTIVYDFLKYRWLLFHRRKRA